MSVVAAYNDEGALLPRSGSARAAILLIALGTSGAARILKHFSPDEIRRLKESAANLASIAPEAIEELVDVFQDAFKKAPGLDGPARQMTELLQGALGDVEFQSLFSVGGSSTELTIGNTDDLWSAVAGMKSEVLAPKLAKEHPQVVAVLLAKIPSETASAIVREFESAFRNAVMRRMLSLKPLSAPVLARFETHVRKAYLGDAATEEAGGGSHATLAEIVNRLDKGDADDLIAAIERVTPHDAETLKKLLFSFEDIETLSQKARLTLFDAVPTETVILALRGAEPALMEVVLSALGARARRMVEAELAQDTAAQPNEIDGARRRIAAEALRLSADGRIQLGAGADA